jgi:ribosomal protein L7/L12
MVTKAHREPDILDVLERIFEVLRDKTTPPFPYDKKTHAIRLPVEVETELRRLVSKGDRIEAIKYVTRLTGAGLRVSKAYVDTLDRKR